MDSDDPQSSTWRWAQRRARERLRGFVIGVIVLPIASAALGVLIGPSTGASVSDHVWWAVWPFLIALVAVIVWTDLVSIFRASFEQRQVLATELERERFRVSELEAQIVNEPVKPDHATTIRRILEIATTAVQSGGRIPFTLDTDMAVIVEHFPEPKLLIDKWDNLVFEATLRQHQLDDRFNEGLNGHSLGPPFARLAFQNLLDVVKHKAREQSLNEPYTIVWRNDDRDDIHFPPELEMTREGWTVAQADPTKMALTSPAIRSRTQQFVNGMVQWSELREYGDLTKRREYEKCQRDLLARLKYRVELDGYVRGNGCLRCPQP